MFQIGPLFIPAMSWPVPSRITPYAVRAAEISLCAASYWPVVASCILHLRWDSRPILGSGRVLRCVQLFIDVSHAF